MNVEVLLHGMHRGVDAKPTKPPGMIPLWNSRFLSHENFLLLSDVWQSFDVVFPYSHHPVSPDADELSRVGCLKAFQQNSLAHLPVTGTGATVKYCYVFCSGLLDEFHAGRLKPQASPVVQIFAGNQDEFDAES
jgi:hypothetical protein